MHRINVLLSIGLAGLLASFSLTAQAKTSNQDLVLPEWGLSVSVGGGVTGFSDTAMRDFSKNGGMWTARATLGTRRPIAFEAGYQGGSQSIDALGLNNDALLISNGLEGNVRANLLTGAMKPYLLAGIGWKNYRLSRVKTNTSAVNDSDSVLEIPVGLGVSYQIDRVIIDARATYRPAVGEDLVRSTTGRVPQDSFAATFHAGIEF